METEKGIITASKGIGEELRTMKVGDVKRFNIPEYNPASIRSMPARLFKERLAGAKWTTTQNIQDKCVYVTRIS